MIRRHVLFVYASLLIASYSARAEDTKFDGLRLGHVFDAESKTIRPVLGSPGAALIAAASDATQFERAVVAGDGSVAVGYLSGAGRLVTIHPSSPQNPLEIADSVAPFDLAALSPKALSAVAYARSCNCVQVLINLRDEPKTSRSLALPEGSSPLAIGINDDASIIAVADDSGKLFVHTAEFANEFNVLASAVSFSADGDSLAVVDSSRRTVAIVSKLKTTPEILEIASERDGLKSPAAVAFLTPSRLLIADTDSKIHILDLEAHSIQSVECPCRPVLVERTSLSDTFRVTNIDMGAVWILQIADQGSRALFIPVYRGPESSESLPEAKE
jgi:hypothetical protein